MLQFILTLCFLSGFSFILGLFPFEWESRPRLQPLGFDLATGKRRKKTFALFRVIALINKPLVSGGLRKRIAKDLAMGHVSLSVEEFLLLKEIGIIVTLASTHSIIDPEVMFFWFSMGVAVGYMLPEFWLKGRIKKVKTAIMKELPDAIDLLGLCVNAGLDFMLALKWVVEKSPPSVIMEELNIVLQEISVGKTRRDALRDLAGRYDLPDLSSFTRTLVQADKMGTSVSEALSIISEDMRLARFRRGEQYALKAPIKMLVPLLFFIFPVVGVLVAGPIFLQFIEYNPFGQ